MGSSVNKSKNSLWKYILLTNKLLSKCTKRGTMASIIFFSLDQPQVLAAKFLYLMCYKWTRVFKMYCRIFFPTCFFPCNRYRFAEIRYHRPEETHKGRTVPAHVETVVLFFPDVWHCLPTRSEWETLSRGYKQQLVEKLQGERKKADGEQALNANPFFYFRFSQAQEHRHKCTPHTT